MEYKFTHKIEDPVGGGGESIGRCADAQGDNLGRVQPKDVVNGFHCSIPGAIFTKSCLAIRSQRMY